MPGREFTSCSSALRAEIPRVVQSSSSKRLMIDQTPPADPIHSLPERIESTTQRTVWTVWCLTQDILPMQLSIPRHDLRCQMCIRMRCHQPTNYPWSRNQFRLCPGLSSCLVPVAEFKWNRRMIRIRKSLEWWNLEHLRGKMSFLESYGCLEVWIKGTISPGASGMSSPPDHTDQHIPSYSCYWRSDCNF